MLLALCGLIGFQWYWIENAIAVKREQFDRKVVEALNQTVNRIEKQEVIFLAQQKIKEQEEKRLEEIAYYRSKATAKAAENKRINQATPLLSQDSKIKVLSKDSTLQIGSKPTFNGIEVSVNNPTDMFINDNAFVPNQRMDLVREIIEEQHIFWNQLSANSQRFIMQENNINDMVAVINNEIGRLQGNIHRKVAPIIRSRRINNTQNFYVEYYTEEVNERSINAEPSKLKIKRPAGDSLLKLNIKKPFAQPKPILAPNIKPSEKLANAKTEEPKVALPTNSEFTKTQNKAELVKDVFKDFMTGERDIYSRLNKQMLDTLLRQELATRGINIPYEYGVKNNGNMIFTSYALNYDPSLSEKAYNARLFPNDALPQNQFLYVYFPEKEDFIMGNMWSVFGSSIFLILMIGGIFYASVNTLMQQKKLSNIKNDFINNMTHEFKTPISTISLAVEVLKDQKVEKSPESATRYLNIIKDENHRLGSQVEKVLQMALLDKGEVKLKLSDVDLNDTIEHVYHNLGMQIDSKGGEVVLDLKAQNSLVKADEVHLTNIIYNLLDNANKYSPEKPQITIATENIANGIKMTISDKGIGMNKEQLGKIFEKFYRVSTGNLHDVKGFGLGLSYVKKMLDLHGAQISVESKPKEGSTFTIVFNQNKA